MAKGSGRMTLDKLAAMVAEGFGFMRAEFNALEERIDGLEATMNAKFLAVHNRLDDLAVNRATRDELAATNARVTRVERHLGLA